MRVSESTSEFPHALSFPLATPSRLRCENADSRECASPRVPPSTLPHAQPLGFAQPIFDTTDTRPAHNKFRVAAPVLPLCSVPPNVRPKRRPQRTPKWAITVVLGNVMDFDVNTQPNLRRPPMEGGCGGSSVTDNSVSGILFGGRQHVVYKHAKAYPEYIVTVA